MSPVNTSFIATSEAKAPAEWRTLLRRWSKEYLGINNGTDVAANLGCLLMLDERDAIEKAEREAKGENFEQLPKSWVWSWLSGGLPALKEWMVVHQEAARDWPFRTRRLRRFF